jgi:glycosyltransferase involved in cell wall biosynthesis
MEGKVSGSVSAAIKLCNRLMAHRQDAVIANCSAGRQMLIDTGVPAGKIHLIYNAVDPARWEGGDRAGLRRELGVHEDTFLMLFAARLVPGKGHTFLLDAIKQMKGNFLLLLAGEGELDGELHQYVNEHGLNDCVRFLGHRSDMKNLYAAADLTVCPSESETLSFLLLESLAAGTPVVATRVGGLIDIVTPDTDCGILVEYGDTAALTAALEHLASQPEERARLAENGKRAIAEHFHIDKLTAGVLALYRG